VNNIINTRPLVLSLNVFKKMILNGEKEDNSLL